MEQRIRAEAKASEGLDPSTWLAWPEYDHHGRVVSIGMITVAKLRELAAEQEEHDGLD